MNADEAEARRREAKRWLVIVDEDLRVSRACLAIDDPAPGSAAYHCQQAAEKVVKALLVISAVTFARTHDMDELVDLALPHHAGQQSLLETVRGITFWAVAYRYPGVEDTPEPLPCDNEIYRMLSAVAGLANHLRLVLSAGEDSLRSL